MKKEAESVPGGAGSGSLLQERERNGKRNNEKLGTVEKAKQEVSAFKSLKVDVSCIVAWTPDVGSTSCPETISVNASVP